MRTALKFAAATTGIAVAAVAWSGTAQARFDASLASKGSAVQPVNYYYYPYGGWSYYAPARRYYAPRYYAPRYYAPRYYRYY